ncbi:GFA family protein [Marilutibacter spongiae]|uniref:GFA family protein n=1 Tax=Marilutibacter spongiae TaxID=2025720 RepID=A0A7W3TPB9_9GAMM|nr:GFA family protein [Lysobacter spongiae]MBB1062000.1 GFA family protein [Lysobacter spongiae]
MSSHAACLCGGVTLEAELARRYFTACHCTMCRRWGGLWMAVECVEVRFGGADGITVYASSEQAERGFCARCGTHLFYRSRWNDRYYVPVGLFDEAEGFVLKREIFFDTKPDYFSLANPTETYTEADLKRKHGLA